MDIPYARYTTRDQALNLWHRAGGAQHGPVIETGTMPLSRLLPLLTTLLSYLPHIAEPQVEREAHIVRALRSPIDWRGEDIFHHIEVFGDLLEENCRHDARGALLYTLPGDALKELLDDKGGASILAMLHDLSDSTAHSLLLTFGFTPLEVAFLCQCSQRQALPPFHEYTTPGPHFHYGLTSLADATRASLAVLHDLEEACWDPDVLAHHVKRMTLPQWVLRANELATPI